ncbi:MAG: alpha/beta fold hydrolase [Rubricoccaceae bacterium]
MVSAYATTPPAAAAAPEVAAAAFADRLHAVVTGPEGAPPLLLLHGWGSSAALMRAAGAPFEATHRVHNLDLPGHGLTPIPPRLPDGRAWGVPEYAALVAHYVREHGLAPVPIVGHSNGGRIALHLASEPSTAALVARLVLVSPSGVAPRRPLAYYAKTAWITALKAPFRLLPEGPLRQRGLAWLRTTVYWQLAASADYRQAAGSDVLRETMVRTVRHLYTEADLARIAVPTLLLWGDRDEAVTRYQMDVLARAIPDAGLVVLEGAGHYGYLDAPAAYAAAVIRFLSPDAS